MVWNRFLACCLLVLSFGAVGQTPEKNLARLIDLMAANANDPPELLQTKIETLMKSYTDDEAFEALSGVLKIATRDAILTPLEVSREMLALVQRYRPRDDVGLDYWRYRIMIAAKLDRGEIKQEEFDYLEGRKLAESDREYGRREALRPAPPVYYAPQPQQPNRIGPMLEAIGAAIRNRRPPVTTTNCTTLGGLTQCQTQ